MPHLRNRVKIRRGQVPLGEGELEFRDGYVTLTKRERVLLRGPAGRVERRYLVFFAHKGLRLGRKWIPRMWYRLTFVTRDAGGRSKDRDGAAAWAHLFREMDAREALATAELRADRAAQAARAGRLRDRAWHRSGRRREWGALQLAGGVLSFVTIHGEAFRIPLSEVQRVRTPWWRSGQVGIKGAGVRHIVGFDPRRTRDREWEKGDSGTETGSPSAPQAAAAEQFAATTEAFYDTSTASYVSSDARETGNAIALVASVLLLLLEGNIIRRLRRREWRPVLRRQTAAETVLQARLEEANEARWWAEKRLEEV